MPSFYLLHIQKCKTYLLYTSEKPTVTKCINKFLFSDAEGISVPFINVRVMFFDTVISSKRSVWFQAGSPKSQVSLRT